MLAQPPAEDVRDQVVMPSPHGVSPNSVSPHAGTPFTDDDATIAAALEAVSIPTLMLSLVHMTGDPELIRGRIKPQGIFLNEYQGYMSEEDKAEVRKIALDVIRDY